MALNKLNKDKKTNDAAKTDPHKKATTARSSDQGRKAASGGNVKPVKKNQQKESK